MNSCNLINGNFITLNNSNSKIKSVVIKKGKISELNTTDRTIPTLDLKGATVIPGFIDAHFHLKNYGKRLHQLNLKNMQSVEDVIKSINNYIPTIEEGDWILGFGWDQNLWSNKSLPDNKILNQITTEHAIYLTRIDGHACWVNNAAIRKTKMKIEEFNNISGGKVVNNCIMIDNAMHPFKAHLPSENISQVKKWINTAVQEAVKKGITGVHDAWQDQLAINAIQELIKEKKFPIRCYGMLASNDDVLLKKFFKEGFYQNEYYNIRSVKAFIDGALGSRGAALHEPYSDDINNCGLILISKEKFKNLAEMCYKYNYQLNTHAIGDRGNEYVLNIYESVLPKNNNRRWRIEHAQMVADRDMTRFKNYSILPSMQPSHCTSDMKWLNQRIGERRLSLISRWNSFIKLGLKIPGGSDCPIESGNPIFEFYAAVTRQDHLGWPEGGWQSQEIISRLDALKMFTTWAAFGGFSEDKRGIIEYGCNADLTVLSQDILRVPSDDILKTKILYTIVNGKIVYNNNE